MESNKKERNKKHEKNKYGEGFDNKEKRLNSPVPKKKKNWKDFLLNINEKED